MAVSKPTPPAGGQRTWNSPEAIARHRAMTPEQRIKKTVELSNQALKMARARRVDDS
jgi:hypothetical protein